MSWTVFNDAARSADQSRAVNERSALIDRLIGHADFYRLGFSAATRGSPLTCSYVAGPGKRNPIATEPLARVIGPSKHRHCFKQIDRGHQDFQIAPIHGHY